MHISAKCSVAIHCLIFIYEYGEQIKVTSELLSKSTGSNPVTIRNILSALKKAGMISVKPGTGGAALACPLREITLYRVFKAIDPGFSAKLMGIHARPSSLCPVGRNIQGVLQSSYEKVQDALCSSLQGITMEEVVTNYRRQAEKTESGSGEA